MKNPELNIGVITPPDKYYKPVLYSDAEASRQFNELDRDVYESRKRYSFEDTKKTPSIIKWGAIGTAIAAGAYWLITKFK